MWCVGVHVVSVVWSVVCVVVAVAVVVVVGVARWKPTCARGAGIHGDVWNVHTEAFWMDTRRRGGREGVTVISAYHNLPTYGYHVLQRFTKETLGSFPFSSVRIGREQHVPDSSNHSLYLMKLLSWRKLPRETATRWFDLSFAPFSKYNERFARQNTRKHTDTHRHRHKQGNTETHTRENKNKLFTLGDVEAPIAHSGATRASAGPSQPHPFSSPQDVFGGTQTSTLSFSMFSFDVLSGQGSGSAQNLSVIATEIDSRNSWICFCNGNCLKTQESVSVTGK